MTIDDAMVALVESGALDEGRTNEYIGLPELLRLLKEHGYKSPSETWPGQARPC